MADLNSSPSVPTRRIVVTVLMHEDDESNMPAIPALENAIQQMALNPGESIESIVEEAIRNA